MAVATGQCVGGGGVAVTQARAGQRAAVGPAWQHACRQPQWTRPFGLLRPVDEIAMLTRRYMHEYGGTREHLANVAIAVRKPTPTATPGR